MNSTITQEMQILKDELSNLSDSSLDNVRRAEIGEELEILRKQRLADECDENARDERRDEDAMDPSLEDDGDPCDDRCDDYYEHGSH